MSFYFSFIAKNKDRALTHIEDMAKTGPYLSVPGQVWAFVSAALLGIRQDGPVSVTAQGHLVTDDSNSYDVSTCTIEVKPLGTQFID